MSVVGEDRLVLQQMNTNTTWSGSEPSAQPGDVEFRDIVQGGLCKKSVGDGNHRWPWSVTLTAGMPCLAINAHSWLVPYPLPTNLPLYLAYPGCMDELSDA